MSHSDVSAGEMDDSGWSDAQLDALLDGGDVFGASGGLSSTVMAIRRLTAETSEVAPSTAVSAFLAGITPVVDLTDSTGRANPGPRRRLRVVAASSAFVGTIGGKILLGAAMAAAAVGGAHATEVIDVPGLPHMGHMESGSDVESPGTTLAAPPGPSTTAASAAPIDSSARIDSDSNAPGSGSAADPGKAEPPGKKDPDEVRNCEFGREQRSNTTTRPDLRSQPSSETNVGSELCPIKSDKSKPSPTTESDPSTSESKGEAKDDKSEKTDKGPDESGTADDADDEQQPVTENQDNDEDDKLSTKKEDSD